MRMPRRWPSSPAGLRRSCGALMVPTENQAEGVFAAVSTMGMGRDVAFDRCGREGMKLMLLTEIGDAQLDGNGFLDRPEPVLRRDRGWRKNGRARGQRAGGELRE